VLKKVLVYLFGQNNRYRLPIIDTIHQKINFATPKLLGVGGGIQFV
jgi:hypothetical protein